MTDMDWLSDGNKSCAEVRARALAGDSIGDGGYPNI